MSFFHISLLVIDAVLGVLTFNSWLPVKSGVYCNMAWLVCNSLIDVFMCCMFWFFVEADASPHELVHDSRTGQCYVVVKEEETYDVCSDE